MSPDVSQFCRSGSRLVAGQVDRAIESDMGQRLIERSIAIVAFSPLANSSRTPACPVARSSHATAGFMRLHRPPNPSRTRRTSTRLGLGRRVPAAGEPGRRRPGCTFSARPPRHLGTPSSCWPRPGLCPSHLPHPALAHVPVYRANLPPERYFSTRPPCLLIKIKPGGAHLIRTALDSHGVTPPAEPWSEDAAAASLRISGGNFRHFNRL